MARAAWWFTSVAMPLIHAFVLVTLLLAKPALNGAPPASAPHLAQWAWWSLRNATSLVSEFTPLLFAPLPVWALTGVVGLLRRRPVPVLAAMAPWLLFGALYGGLFVPRPAHAAALRPPQGMALRVMTFNVLEINRSPARLAEVIRQANPDVLVVQELTPALSAGLDAALKNTYPYRHLRPAPNYNGVGTWSRYPIVASESWADLQPAPRWQYTAVSVSGQTVHVANLHLSAPDVRWRRLPFVPKPLIVGQDVSERRAQVAALTPRLQALAQSGAPTIVAGDLNMTDQAQEYRQLLGTHLHDAYRAAGWGFGLTFPATPVAYYARHAIVARPVLGIDHVLVSGDVQVRHIRVWPSSGGSDHLPLVAELVVPAAAGS